MKSTVEPRGSGGVLARLGLGRPELRAWAMYDWANSAFATTVMAAVLPVYFARVAAAALPAHVATAYWGYTASLSLLVIALASPFLGAMGDYLGAKKRFLAAFLTVGTVATAALALVGPGDWLLAAGLYLLGNIGFSGSIIFSDSLLPHIARPDEIDRVSSGGWALGYLGGGLLLAFNVALLTAPQFFGLADAAAASRVSFLTVAVWWAVFSLPLLLRVPEPPRRLLAGESGAASATAAAARRLRGTFGELRRYRHLLRFLLAYWLYIDGVGTIIKLATIYGSEIGIGASALIGALLLAQFVGIPFTFAFGALAARAGVQAGLYVALAGYAVISVCAYFVREAWHFWALAVAVATVQGGAQALSRSLFASMIPAAKSSEFFSFFSVFEKFAGIMGPALFGLIAQLTGTSRAGIATLVVFFLGGMALLARVDVAEGRRAALREDTELHPAGPAL